MKKTIISFAIFTLLVTVAGANTTSQLDSANKLAWDGIINDKSANPAEYNLDQNVLRQEIAAVARWVADIQKTTQCRSEFSDVSATTPNTWACYSIEALLNADLIASNETFRPEDNITKAEWLGMLVKAACGDEYAYDASQPGNWQEQVVAYADEKAIVETFTDYNTLATRGWVFEVGAEARDVCGTEDEIDKILEELLGEL
jgi:hypothetical protein